MTYSPLFFFFVHCRREGVRGFYKGLLPSLLRVTPATALTFVVYENVFHGLKSFTDRKRDQTTHTTEDGGSSSSDDDTSPLSSSVAIAIPSSESTSHKT